MAEGWLSGGLPVHQCHLVSDLLDKLELLDLLLLQCHQLVQDHGDGHGGDTSGQGTPTEALRELGHSHAGALQDLQSYIGAGNAAACHVGR